VSIYFSGSMFSREEQAEINMMAKQYLLSKGAVFEDFDAFEAIGMPYVQFSGDGSNKNGEDLDDFKGRIIFKKRAAMHSFWTSPFPHDICRITIAKSEEGIGQVIINTWLNGTSIICYSRIEIEEEVGLGPNVLIMDNDGHLLDRKYSAEHGDKPGKSKPIKICRGAMIGYGSTILKGVTVGEYAVVGANSVVTKDVPPRTVVAGNPARIIRTYNT